MSTKRRWVIEEAMDPETGEPTGRYDREQLLGCMEEVEHVLYMVGGMAAFTAERVQVDELGGEPIAVSRRVIVDWSAFAPMRREMDDEPASPELEEAAAALAAEIAATEPDEPDEDEDVDRSLTTTGPPREDATL